VQSGLAPAVRNAGAAAAEWWGALPEAVQKSQPDLTSAPGPLGLSTAGESWADAIWQAAAAPSGQIAGILARAAGVVQS